MVDKVRLLSGQAFIHVSTGYCNTERPLVEERVYAAPAHAPLERALALAASAPKEMLAQLTPE